MRQPPCVAPTAGTPRVGATGGRPKLSRGIARKRGGDFFTVSTQAGSEMSANFLGTCVVIAKTTFRLL